MIDGDPGCYLYCAHNEWLEIIIERCVAAPIIALGIWIAIAVWYVRRALVRARCHAIPLMFGALL